MDNGKSVMDKDYDSVNMQDEKAERGRMTPEDIAKRAQAAEAEKDAEFEAKMRATEQEIERMEKESKQKKDDEEDFMEDDY